jgi:hypothetical protein
MAHLWIQKTCESGRCWAALPLAGSAYQFIDGEPFVRRVGSRSARAGGVLLMRIVRDSAEQWFLLVPAAARLAINGRPPVLGAHALADRDEIRLRNRHRLYFSTERRPAVVPFPGAAHEMCCARCRKPIAQGTPAVACPACGAWCHEQDDLPCWSYEGSTHCPLCEQLTDPEAGFRWVPNGL